MCGNWFVSVFWPVPLRHALWCGSVKGDKNLTKNIVLQICTQLNSTHWIYQTVHIKNVLLKKRNRNYSETEEKHSLSECLVTLDWSTLEGVFRRDRPENWNKSIFAQRKVYICVESAYNWQTNHTSIKLIHVLFMQDDALRRQPTRRLQGIHHPCGHGEHQCRPFLLHVNNRGIHWNPTYGSRMNNKHVSLSS